MELVTLISYNNDFKQIYERYAKVEREIKDNLQIMRNEVSV